MFNVNSCMPRHVSCKNVCVTGGGRRGGGGHGGRERERVSVPFPGGGCCTFYELKVHV